MLRAPEVGARSAPALRAQASPCPSRYRLDLGAPSLSHRGGACPRPDHRFLAKSVHVLRCGAWGGATLSHLRPDGRFCPLRGLVARFAPNKGGFSRLPFRSPPSPSGRGWRLPSPLGQSGWVGALPLPPFFSASALCQRLSLRAVSPECGCLGFASASRVPSVRHLWASFIGCRHVLRAKEIPSPFPPTTLKNATRAHLVLRRGASPPDAYNRSLRSRLPVLGVK